MASRNADRISVRDWRPRAETVAQMRQLRWRVVAKCGTCRTELAVDLARVERARGADFSLWDRDTKCRRQAATAAWSSWRRGRGWRSSKS